jgi:hypothetical protein
MKNINEYIKVTYLMLLYLSAPNIKIENKATSISGTKTKIEQNPEFFISFVMI